MKNQETDMDWQFLIMLLCIVAAFGAGISIGGKIGDRTAKQYYEEGGDVNRNNHRAFYRHLGGDDTDVRNPLQAMQGNKGGVN